MCAADLEPQGERLQEIEIEVEHAGSIRTVATTSSARLPVATTPRRAGSTRAVVQRQGGRESIAAWKAPAKEPTTSVVWDVAPEGQGKGRGANVRQIHGPRRP